MGSFSLESCFSCGFVLLFFFFMQILLSVLICLEPVLKSFFEKNFFLNYSWKEFFLSDLKSLGAGGTYSLMPLESPVVFSLFRSASMFRK